MRLDRGGLPEKRRDPFPHRSQRDRRHTQRPHHGGIRRRPPDRSDCPAEIDIRRRGRALQDLRRHPHPLQGHGTDRAERIHRQLSLLRGQVRDCRQISQRRQPRGLDRGRPRLSSGSRRILRDHTRGFPSPISPGIRHERRQHHHDVLQTHQRHRLLHLLLRTLPAGRGDHRVLQEEIHHHTGQQGGPLADARGIERHPDLGRPEGDSLGQRDLLFLDIRIRDGLDQVRPQLHHGQHGAERA